MALPDTIKYVPGTPVIWGENGATGVTLVLTFEALAAGSARMGAVADLGASWDMDYMVMLVIETGTAPTAGTRVDLYLACTHSTSFYPAGVTGSDAAWPADGEEDEWALQLGAPVVSLMATADGNAIQKQAPVIWHPSGRYVVPVVDNNMDQAVRDETTATDNDSRVILVPLVATIAD